MRGRGRDCENALRAKGCLDTTPSSSFAPFVREWSQSSPRREGGMRREVDSSRYEQVTKSLGVWESLGV